MKTFEEFMKQFDEEITNNTVDQVPLAQVVIPLLSLYVGSMIARTNVKMLSQF